MYRLLKLYGLYILIAVVGRGLEDLIQLTELAPLDGRGDPSLAGLFLIGLTTFIWSLLSSAVGLTFSAKLLFARSMPPSLSVNRTVQLMCIETIRAVASSLLRLPLLVLPGLFQWVRLTPISYLILFDSAYRTGEVDALERAREFFKIHRIRVLFFLLLSIGLFLIEFSVTESPVSATFAHTLIWQQPIQHVGSIGVFALLRLGLDACTLGAYASQFPQLTAPQGSMSHKL